MSNYLITGGSGTLGEALTKELLRQKAHKIAILTNDENQIVEFKEKYKSDSLRYFLGDIREKDRLKRAFYKMDYVIHSAALKHVDIGENNPEEILKTNILGTMNIVGQAIDSEVKKVLVVSSDKAADPSNIYGQSKLFAEKLSILYNVYTSRTKISAVRFGNFLGSRGSVFDKLKDQLVYTITDTKMKRYWIDPSTAARYCLRFLKIMKGKEVFIPKMREALLIDEITNQPWFDKNKEFVITGIRKGEKLREKLWGEHEKVKEIKDYYVIA
jgi:UDP-N-acetylglucosamine 4,6-dehydratase